ncbi:hypothetical protein [Bacillus cereus]|uniref:hypothetical protein n=1 Tax=Bacillus cereus TaxID=1396 RepID=UPI00124D3756|nr:hypothetical protein [Bacillus cereus]KAB2397331.1 hypothetical protein F8171_06605 [Bacillus cereus]
MDNYDTESISTTHQLSEYNQSRQVVPIPTVQQIQQFTFYNGNAQAIYQLVNQQQNGGPPPFSNQKRPQTVSENDLNVTRQIPPIPVPIPIPVPVPGGTPPCNAPITSINACGGKWMTLITRNTLNQFVPRFVFLQLIHHWGYSGLEIIGSNIFTFAEIFGNICAVTCI